MSSRTTRKARLTNSRSVISSTALTFTKDMWYQGNVSKQKAALQKHAVVVKTQQKEVQTATLELGQ